MERYRPAKPGIGPLRFTGMSLEIIGDAEVLEGSWR